MTSSTNHDIPIFFFMMSQKWFTVKFDGKNPWISSTMTLAIHGCNTKVSENSASPKRLLSHKGVSERGVFPQIAIEWGKSTNGFWDTLFFRQNSKNYDCLKNMII